MSVELICQFIIYLYKARQLRHGSIKNYIAGVKFITAMAGASTDNFQTFFVRKLMTAIANREWAMLKEKPPNRCAMTFSSLCIFGDELFKLKSMHPWTRLNMWGAALLSYSAQMRLGDFLPDCHGFDKARVLSWDKFRVIEDDHLSFVIVLPKNTASIKKQGATKDVIRFRDKRFCPVSHLLKILHAQKQEKTFSWSMPVFTKASGRPLYSYDINKAIERLLDPLFGDKFSGHSFRCGVTSVMAEHPDKFTNDMVMQHGGWQDPKSTHGYSRRMGVGIKATKELINSLTY